MIVIAPSVNEPNVISPLTSNVADSNPAEAIKFVALTLLLNAPVVAPLNAPLLNVAVPSVNEPPVTAPLAVMFVAPLIAPEDALNAPSVNVPPVIVPLAVKPVTLGVASKSIVNLSVADTEVVMFVPPSTSTVSPPSIACEPLSAVNNQEVCSAVSPAAVKRPCWSTVKFGMVVALPYEPGVTAVLSSETSPLLAESPVPPVTLASIAALALATV